MAIVLAICKCVVILTVITCLQILLTVGRQMKSINKQELVSRQQNSQQKMANRGSNTINLQQNPSRSIKVSTSQPAAPSDQISSVNQPKSIFLNNSSGSSESPAANEDDFHPTHPGFSDIGMHPSSKCSTEDTELKVPAGSSSISKHSPAGYKDDFRPTQPGFSPGVGHPLSEDIKDTTPEVAAGYSSVRSHSMARHKGDFRPTPPVHSAVVGHVF